MAVRFLPEYLSHLNSDARFLTAVWGLFLLLVAVGIHGAPTPAMASHWSTEPYTGYVFESLAARAKERSLQSESLRELLMTEPPATRIDDYFFRFPLALSQLTHSPRFPAVNTNYWNGMSALTQPQYDIPVWHISALARPGSWGYFFLGAQRGLAWNWWFQVFACFSVLYLLLSIILDGDRKLAAFGSFWFCGSAAIVCFSYWPTYVTFYAALATLSSYWLLKSPRPRVQIFAGVLLGLSIAGFVMILYPPWQPPLAYLFLLILIGLIVRDKLYPSIVRPTRWRLLATALTIIIAGVILAGYLSSGWPAIKTMAGTVYPGSRRTTGGDFPFWRLFAGAYNLITSFHGMDIRNAAGATYHLNRTESSSFYLFFPAVFVPLISSSRWRKPFGVVGWSVAAFLVFLLVYMRLGLPTLINAATLFNRTYSQRLIPVVGLCSIIICLRALQCARRQREPTSNYLSTTAAALVTLLFGISGIFIAAQNAGSPSAENIVITSLAGGGVSYLLLKGRIRPFCTIVIAGLVPILWTFNPLSTNLDYIYKSEMAQKIQEFDRQSSVPPLWICYDEAANYEGMLVAILGARTVSGIQWPPDLAFWHALDPTREHEALYNRYAHVRLHYTDAELPSFALTGPIVLDVGIRPDNPALKEMGAKYILAQGEAASRVNPARFPLLYRSPTENFSIFEIP
ncbi:MAG TPA: hypothetical protein VLZ81_06830 [Blastocatellia bacterium]|nr:hypothetical protein [Blastocatellia bacterium]